MTELPKKITDDPYGAAVLVRRLVVEQGLAYWRRYLTAFALMGIAADRVDQETEDLRDGIRTRGQARQEFGRVPLREEGDAFAHQLGEQPALVVGEDGVGDLR